MQFRICAGGGPPVPDNPPQLEEDGDDGLARFEEGDEAESEATAACISAGCVRACAGESILDHCAGPEDAQSEQAGEVPNPFYLKVRKKKGGEEFPIYNFVAQVCLFNECFLH